MINIVRPTIVPTAISGKGVSETTNNNNKYNRARSAYNSGRSKFKIKSSIYNATAVKKSLKIAQHKKCCFCEKLQGDEYGAVEHYRPKGGYKQQRADKVKKPGYYWEGYNWSNLLFVCGPCNTNKGNIFPLKDLLSRAKNHTMDMSLEEALLLNPAGAINPRDHIIFNNQFINGISNEGTQTIGICKLDRDSLNEERAKILGEIEERVLILISNADPDATLRASNYLRNCIQPTAPFSAMAQDYIANSPIVIS